MDPDETTLISGRIVAEFEDDASQFLAGEAEFVNPPNTAVVTPLPTSGITPTTVAGQGKTN